MNNFLLGFGIGLTVGVLFAPKSGDQTREYLANKASESADFLAEQGQQIKDTASNLVEQGRNILNEQKDRFAGSTQSGTKAYQPV